MCLLALYERAKSRNDWCFRLRLYEYFLCQAFQFRERLDATTTFCNVADRFTLRSLTLFRVCSCVYVNFSFMKRQQKLSLFFYAIIGLFRLYNYLTVSSYCNKQIKTVKSIKTIIGIKNSKTLKLT